MLSLILKLLAALAIAILCLGQEVDYGEASLTARDLFLEGSRAQASSDEAETNPPLGLRYSVLKQHKNGEFAAVDPDESFSSGDRIRLRIEVNNAGYLYVVHRGSSGIWSALFPQTDASAVNNAVQKGGKYEIPAGLVWAFDQKPGIEKLFIVFSRHQQPSLEGLVDAIRDKSDAQPEKTGPTSKEYLATIQPSQRHGQIDDAVIAQMSQLYSRDIRLQTVFEKDAENNIIPAVYVANPSRASDSIVLKEVSLIHR